MIEICLVYCLSSGQFGRTNGCLSAITCYLSLTHHKRLVVIGRMEQLANQMILGELMANWLN